MKSLLALLKQRKYVKGVQNSFVLRTIARSIAKRLLAATKAFVTQHGLNRRSILSTGPLRVQI